MTSCDPRRAVVVAEAESWLRTPYHHMGRVKHVGVDCLTLLAEVYEAAGVIPHIDVPYYPPDWHFHRDNERYMDGLLLHAVEVTEPLPGDVALFKFGRCFSHGAIVIEWPRIIHAWIDAGVIRGNAMSPQLSKRATRFFSPFIIDGA